LIRAVSVAVSELASGANAEFAVDLCERGFDGVGGEDKLLCDFAVGEPAGDEVGDALLGGG
jgi:hypothetical protein